MRSIKNILSLLILGMIISSCSEISGTSIPFASVPSGMGYADGKEVYFSHTEVSDPAVGKKLTAMMNSPVIVVPSLAKIPAELTNPVYVFENGKAGKGPLGFQADVFNNPPGTEGYSPLRRILFVNWKEESKAVVLTSESEILSKEKNSEIDIKPSDIVVNMPFMVWDGGKR
jgi:hypothetical protein